MNIFEKTYCSTIALTDLDGTESVRDPGAHLPRHFLEELLYSTSKEHSFQGPRVYSLMFAMKALSDTRIDDISTKFFSSTAKNIKEETIERVSKNYFSKKIIPGYLEMLDAVRNYGPTRKPLIIVSRNPLADYAKDLLNADHVISNKVGFKNGVFDNVDRYIVDEEDKLAKVKEYGINPKKCILFADGDKDKLLARECNAVIIPRWANSELKKEPNTYQIDHRGEFARILQAKMQSMQ